LCPNRDTPAESGRPWGSPIGRVDRQRIRCDPFKDQITESAFAATDRSCRSPRERWLDRASTVRSIGRPCDGNSRTDDIQRVIIRIRVQESDLGDPSRQTPDRGPNGTRPSGSDRQEVANETGAGFSAARPANWIEQFFHYWPPSSPMLSPRNGPEYTPIANRARIDGRDAVFGKTPNGPSESLLRRFLAASPSKRRPVFGPHRSRRDLRKRSKGSPKLVRQQSNLQLRRFFRVWCVPITKSN